MCLFLFVQVFANAVLFVRMYFQRLYVALQHLFLPFLTQLLCGSVLYAVCGLKPPCILQDSMLSSTEFSHTFSWRWAFLHPTPPLPSPPLPPSHHNCPRRACLHTSPHGPRRGSCWEHLPRHGISGLGDRHTLHLMSCARWFSIGPHIPANTWHYPPLQVLLN